MNNWFVYIIECSDLSLYTGTSNNVEKRINKHNSGSGAKYTRGRIPVKLIRQFGPMTKSEALSLEYKIKQMSRDEKLKFEDK
jgi:putative endonuclease